MASNYGQSNPAGNDGADEAGGKHAAAAEPRSLPLDETFQALAEDAGDRKLRRAARELADQLRNGASLDDALAQLRRRIPEYLHRTLASAAGVDQIATVIESVSQLEASRRRLRREVIMTLLYPSVVLALLAVVITLMSTYVVPQFADAYKDFDLPLPVSTNLLLSFSSGVWFFWRIAAGVFIAFVLLAALPFGRRLLFWLRTGLPIVGPIATLGAQHEFASIMAALTAQRVPTDEALRCTVGSLRDRNLARAASIAADKCEGGLSLSRSLAESIHIDPTLPALVHWGEEHDAVAEALAQASGTYEEQIELYADLLRRCLPPLLLTAVVGIVFFYVSSLLVPLVQLINSLT